jgi:predicted lipoprotein with Yx(FWY)xxD motif
MAGSPRTQTTDQAMRKENGIELSNWEKDEKEKKKPLDEAKNSPPLIETNNDDHRGRRSDI